MMAKANYRLGGLSSPYNITCEFVAPYTRTLRRNTSLYVLEKENLGMLSICSMATPCDQ